MAERRLAIIGGGPKAAAISAKAACLREIAGIPIEVTVFERDALGGAWTGLHGYSDGLQQLCTPAERDLGYPYDDAEFGPTIVRAMQSEYSWAAHAVEAGIYADWVDRGRPRPTHREFADYVASCVVRSGATVVYGTVTSLTIAGGKWTVHHSPPAGGASRQAKGFHGVVVTGTGPAAKRITDKVVDIRIFDGVSFWQGLSSIVTLAKATSEPIVIIGSGGTAAATAAWCVRQGLTNEIVIMGGDQAALFARTESVFENRAFRDEEIWESLSSKHRMEFTSRLTRGAVWANVVDQLAHARNVSYRPGRVFAIRHDATTIPPGLVVGYRTSRHPDLDRYEAAGVVVDATGFDEAWFAELLSKRLRNKVRKNSAQLRAAMPRDLTLPLGVGARLHAPMMSEAVSPALSSLMALGTVADLVLRPYVDEALY